MTLNWNSGELADGLQCYRSEQFFEAHEHWEAVWLRSQEPEKTFLQALIQVTAAFHHLQRNNITGAISLLKSALRRLQPYPSLFGGISVQLLREEVLASLRMLEAELPETREHFPRIEPMLFPQQSGAA
jgi:uncharacterized protein